VEIHKDDCKTDLDVIFNTANRGPTDNAFAAPNLTVHLSKVSVRYHNIISQKFNVTFFKT